ncbi:urease accessory protein UreH domain-containing protein [Rhizobium ruizarguesonis]|uniref:urease accessory protein UreH domain-containing protein n=1 Tax=Rhizobium ruizarguesonis TaxID=2081791 RepID=UPI0013D15131|nr:sulfite exporter TauE/SafE family protein [Rhizobium ruizarguesonis]NEH81432.1 High-affinity nickel transporter [Rhizobium ruizarguesonis]NEI81875.1 High-affinity nickel transporter [Rhizobium ruizarguesonis]
MPPFVLMTLLASGLLAGFVHVVSGPDHLAAIAPYAVDAKARAWRTGIRWGVGHSAGVVGVGLFALLLRDTMSIDIVSAWGERFVGAMLCGIGIWGLRAAFADQAPTHSQGHRGHPHGHRHKHPAFAIGTVHGLAGSSHLLGIVPALALPTNTEAAAYLLVFGLGTIAAMATFSTFIGLLAGRPGARSVKVQNALMASFSMLAIVVGGVWFCQGI